MKRAILFLFITLGTCCGSLAAAQSIPFRLYRNYLILTNCSVAGQGGLTAVIDTGTTETILDLGVMNRLALENWPDSATSLNKDAPARGVRIPNLELGPVRIPVLHGVAMDLSSIARELGVALDVVVGMDVLRQTSFVIDYNRKTITFGSVPALARNAALARGFRFALVDSDIFGKKLRLQIDTGVNGVLVYGDRLHGMTLPAADGARVTGVAQTAGVRSVDSSQVEIGNWRASHLPIAVMEGAPRDFDEFDGLLGPRFLGAHRVAFDFEHGMLYWD